MGDNTHTARSYLWMWLAGSVVVPALLLTFFIWHISTKGSEEGLEAAAVGRVASVMVPMQVGEEAKPGPATPAPSPELSALVPPPGDGLKAAPADSLSVKTPLGILPRIASDGTKPWLYYSRPFNRTTGESPVIAVVVTGLGLGKQVTDQALHLPPEVSLSFSPYAADAAIWAGSARAVGHEVLVDLPFEPSDYPLTDPGPYALMTGLPPNINEQNLRWVLTRFPGYIGGVAMASEHFIQSRETARPPLHFFSGCGLMLVMASTGVLDLTRDMLEKIGLPYVGADVRLDKEMTRDTITVKLQSLERAARTHGHALLVVEATPLILKELAGWAELIGQKGIIIAPVSALARLKFS